MKWIKVLCAVALVAGFGLVLALNMQPTGTSIMQEVNRQKGTFALPPLPFGYDALEPYIDAKTVDIHYNRHHKAYVDALNRAILGSSWDGKTLEQLFEGASKLPDSIRNNAGGHWNHSFYWSIMRSAKDNFGPSEKLQKALTQAFGSVDAFKQEFRQAGINDFGSGWVWLVRLPDGSLKVVATANQDNPLMDNSKWQGKPLLACDVWEHAYYLKYLNRRDTYLDAFWSIVDWKRVEELFEQK